MLKVYRVKTHVQIRSVEDMDGQLHHSDCGRANAFNDFFFSVFVEEDPNTVPSFTFTTDDEDPTPLSAINITPATVFDKLQSLKSDKSPGPDRWPSAILKTVPSSCVFP